ncbi:hypothetical protein HGRIS_012166 [Hohenbuehelia grisea]|uniref:F-box protein n=1 Tax=Hohenbuehelia grisea TaxID=104357 RepID=A0ABR3IRH5_9AGAR
MFPSHQSSGAHNVPSDSRAHCHPQNQRNQHPNGVFVTVSFYQAPPPPPPPTPTSLYPAPVQLIVTSTPDKEYSEQVIENAGTRQQDQSIVHYPSSSNDMGTSTPIERLSVEILIRIFEFALDPILVGKNDKRTPLAALGVNDNKPMSWKQFMAIGRTNGFWRTVLHKYFRVVPFPDSTNTEIVQGLLESMKKLDKDKDIAMVDALISRADRHREIYLMPSAQNIMEKYLASLRVLKLHRELIWDNRQAVIQYFDHEAPKLETFALTGLSDAAPQKIQQLFRNCAPALRKINLSRCYLRGRSPLLQKLTHLALNFLQRAPEKDVYAMLRAARNLVSLDLSFGLPLDASKKDQAPLEFPYLRCLRIADQDGLGPVLRFLEHLRAPSELEIGLSWHWMNITADDAAPLHARLKDILEEWRQGMRTGESQHNNGRAAIPEVAV